MGFNSAFKGLNVWPPKYELALDKCDDRTATGRQSSVQDVPRFR